MITENVYPTNEYIELHRVISFDGFEYYHHLEHEVKLLQPRLEAQGYHHIQWLPGETDSFGPLTRVCRAADSNNEVVWFVYG